MPHDHWFKFVIMIDWMTLPGLALSQDSSQQSNFTSIRSLIYYLIIIALYRIDFKLSTLTMYMLLTSKSYVTVQLVPIKSHALHA